MSEDLHQDIELRKLKLEEIVLVIPLMVAMGKVDNEREAKTRVEAVINDPAHLLAIAKTQGQIVGYVWAQNLGPHLRTGVITARTHDRFVAEDFRGEGIGDQLIEYTKQWAKDLGAKYLQGATNPKGVERLKRHGAVFDSQEEFEKHPPFEFQF